MSKFISDKIEEEFKEWKSNELIFISAHTGSGKTFFILDELVKFAHSKEVKILYLVNRKILKMQIEKKVNIDVRSKLKVESTDNIIDIMTYQELENRCKNDTDYMDCKGKYDLYKILSYGYIVCDECHYFFSDSTFNTNTELSYRWIKNRKFHSCLIFMSATIKRIKKYIYEDLCIKSNEHKKSLMSVNIKRGNITINPSRKVYEYDVIPDYSYINFHILDDTKEIIEQVKNKKGKWLIFVDNIKKGNDINQLLVESGIDSIFIDARWINGSMDLIDTVNNIANNEHFKQQVVISTSVMDNGISIKDMNLKNLVIMADTREEFIQMLGRKRYIEDLNGKDNADKKIDLYIFKKKKIDFIRRLNSVETYIEMIGKYNSNKGDFSYKLERILESDVWYQSVKHSYYVMRDFSEYKENDDIKDILALNKFSDRQYMYLRENYINIIDKFDKKGENAFIEQQLKWLNIKKKDRRKIIDEISLNLKDKIVSIIDEYIDRELTKDQNMELREKIRCDLATLLIEGDNSDREETKKVINDLRKSSGTEKEELYQKIDLTILWKRFILVTKWKRKEKVCIKL